MYFEDLTPYSYYRRKSFENVLNVGWLDAAHIYNSKKVASDFVEKFGLLIIGSIGCDINVNKIRGLHPCNLCGMEVVHTSVCGKELLLGASELWVPFDSGWYAAPSMILHYISDHQYAPPDGFVDAVMKMDLAEKYSGQDVYDRLCMVGGQ